MDRKLLRSISAVVCQASRKYFDWRKCSKWTGCRQSKATPVWIHHETLGHRLDTQGPCQLAWTPIDKLQDKCSERALFVVDGGPAMTILYLMHGLDFPLSVSTTQETLILDSYQRNARKLVFDSPKRMATPEYGRHDVCLSVFERSDSTSVYRNFVPRRSCSSRISRRLRVSSSVLVT